MKAIPLRQWKYSREKFGYDNEEKSGILTHLIQGGDLTAYGLANAITRTSQDITDYDRATDFERDGSKVLSLPATTWKAIAFAK